MYLFPSGRRCIEPDCITILCYLNPGPKCFCHTGIRPPSPVEWLLELMGAKR